ncbi:MAG: glycosyltransferase family 2 protein [Patescibacteria group bacterium]
MSKNQVLVIIPTYNEAENIAAMLAAAVKHNVDVLVVDDGSPDGTARIVKSLSADSHIHLLERPAKSGLGLAYRDGFRWGLTRGYGYFVSIDADFSHNPSDIDRLIEASRMNKAIAIGSRYVAGGKISGWDRKRLIQSKLANWFARLLLGLKAKDVTAGFKCYPASFVSQFVSGDVVAPGYAFQVETLFSAKLKQVPVVEVPITFSERRAGRSKVSGELPKAVVAVFRLMLRRPTLRQLVKFGIVGWINVAIDFGFLNLFVIVGGLSPLVAGLLSTAMALTNSYLLNRAWTFRGFKGPDERGAEFLSFLAVNGTGATVNWIIFAGLFTFFGLNYNVAKAIAILITTFWNFFGSKKFVFSKKT